MPELRVASGTPSFKEDDMKSHDETNPSEHPTTSGDMIVRCRWMVCPKYVSYRCDRKAGEERKKDEHISVIHCHLLLPACGDDSLPPLPCQMEGYSNISSGIVYRGQVAVAIPFIRARILGSAGCASGWPHRHRGSILCPVPISASCSVEARYCPDGRARPSGAPPRRVRSVLYGS